MEKKINQEMLKENRIQKLRFKNKILKILTLLKTFLTLFKAELLHRKEKILSKVKRQKVNLKRIWKSYHTQ